RPYGQGAQGPLEEEIQLVHFLEREHVDVSYQTDLNTDLVPSSLLSHRLVTVAGHDEYWTKEIRDAFDKARDLGTNLAFMSSNIGTGRFATRTVAARSSATRTRTPIRLPIRRLRRFSSDR